MRKTVFLFLSIVCCSVAIAQKTNSGLKLWYNKPATIWEEALPLGNAKTGAMVFGGVAEERFQLNDNTLWSGYPNPCNVFEGTKIKDPFPIWWFSSDILIYPLPSITK